MPLRALSVSSISVVVVVVVVVVVAGGARLRWVNQPDDRRARKQRRRGWVESNVELGGGEIFALLFYALFRSLLVC